MYGPGFGFGLGFHALILFAFVLLWLGVIAGVLWALYFVVRTAVTRGILRADDIRSGAVVDPRHRAHHVPPPAPRQDEARPYEARPDTPRTDTPPDVAA